MEPEFTAEEVNKIARENWEQGKLSLISDIQKKLKEMERTAWGIDIVRHHALGYNSALTEVSKYLETL